MAVAFARTIRSLTAHDFRGPAIAWILAVIMLAGWTWWFFAAEIPVPSDSLRGARPEIERISPARLALRAIERPIRPPVPKAANDR